MITIHLIRNPRFTGGFAYCETGGRRFETPKAKGKVAAAPIWPVLGQLVAAGYEGEDYEVHDGRMVVLQGVICRYTLPVKYGGEKRPEDAAEAA